MIWYETYWKPIRGFLKNKYGTIWNWDAVAGMHRQFVLYLTNPHYCRYTLGTDFGIGSSTLIAQKYLCVKGSACRAKCFSNFAEILVWSCICYKGNWWCLMMCDLFLLMCCFFCILGSAFSLTFLQRCFCSWNRTNKSGKHLNQPFCAFLYPCYTVPRRVWQLFGFGKQVSTTPAFDRPWPLKAFVSRGHRMHAWYHVAIVVDANWHWTSSISRHLFVVFALGVVIFIPVPLEHIFHWSHFQTGKQVLHG